MVPENLLCPFQNTGSLGKHGKQVFAHVRILATLSGEQKSQLSPFLAEIIKNRSGSRLVLPDNVTSCLNHGWGGHPSG